MPVEALEQFFWSVLQDAPAVAVLGWLVHRELHGLSNTIREVADRVAHLEQTTGRYYAVRPHEDEEEHDAD